MKITRTNLRTKEFVSSTSRYANSEVIYYGDQNYITFTTYKRKPIEINAEDKFVTIPPGMAYRPDLLSYKAYGTPNFWWRIMEANNIIDIFDFIPGRTVRIPTDILA